MEKTSDVVPVGDEKNQLAPPSYDAGSGLDTYIKPQLRKVHDPDVTFEEYHYYAKRTREEELTLEKPRTNWSNMLSKKKTAGEVDVAANMPTEEELASRENRVDISDEEWTNASRAFRTASAGACKFFSH